MRILISGFHNLLLYHHDLKPDSDFLPRNGHVGRVRVSLVGEAAVLEDQFFKTSSPGL